MARTLLLALVVLAVVAATLSIRSCEQAPPVAAHDNADMSAVVSLPDGTVMTAPRGSAGRDIVDWIASADGTERRFELGGRQFEGRSAEPTIESRVRIRRGIAILKANPTVAVDVIGYSSDSGDPEADRKLSLARAQWIVDALHEGGISQSRLTADGRGSADPIGDNTSPEGRARNERVVMILRHQR